MAPDKEKCFVSGSNVDQQGLHQRTRSDVLCPWSEYVSRAFDITSRKNTTRNERINALDPTLVREELSRNSRVTQKEVRAIFGRFFPVSASRRNKEAASAGWKKPRRQSLLNVAFAPSKDWHKSFVEDVERTKVGEAQAEIAREADRAEKCRLRNFTMRKRRDVIKELRDERKLEQTAVAARLKEEHRLMLLEKIARHDQRSLSIVKGREALHGLRQEIIRNARICKHNARCALEKERRRAIDSGKDMQTMTCSELFGPEETVNSLRNYSTVVSGKKGLDSDREVRGINERARRLARLRAKERNVLGKLSMYTQACFK